MSSWTYSQKTGEMWDPDDTVVEVGYSGAGFYTNRPAADFLSDRGPIPEGSYTIEPAVEHPSCGPCSLPLTPDPANEMHGREGFLIHGDTDPPGNASTGCIIMSRETRDLIDASAIKQLKVVV